MGASQAQITIAEEEEFLITKKKVVVAQTEAGAPAFSVGRAQAIDLSRAEPRREGETGRRQGCAAVEHFTTA